MGSKIVNNDVQCCCCCIHMDVLYWCTGKERGPLNINTFGDYSRTGWGSTSLFTHFSGHFESITKEAYAHNPPKFYGNPETGLSMCLALWWCLFFSQNKPSRLQVIPAILWDFLPKFLVVPCWPPTNWSITWPKEFPLHSWIIRFLLSRISFFNNCLVLWGSLSCVPGRLGQGEQWERMPWKPCDFDRTYPALQTRKPMRAKQVATWPLQLQFGLCWDWWLRRG